VGLPKTPRVILWNFRVKSRVRVAFSGQSLIKFALIYSGKTARKLTIMNDNLGTGFYDFLLKACTNMLAVTKGAVYICMSSAELHTLYRAFTDAATGPRF
jgi:hypothetical protein